MKNVLFLHMGPGLNAFPERKLLSASHPQTDFWDQPPIATPEKSFSLLVQAVQEKINRMYIETKKPVRIMAHSFGGHLITHALKAVGDKVSACEFFATGYDLPGGFFKLLKTLLADSKTEDALKSEIQQFLKSGKTHPSAADIWNYIGLIVKDPSFMRLYWPSEELHKRYLKISSTGPQLDALTFQYVLSDFMNSNWTESPETSSWSGPITIHLGAKDPLLDVDREANLWKRIYPQSEFRTHFNSGHYVHLEDALNNFYS